MIFKRERVTTGELSERTWKEYYATCERLLKVFGKDRLLTDIDARDFETLRSNIARQWGYIRLGNEVQRAALSSSSMDSILI